MRRWLWPLVAVCLLAGCAAGITPQQLQNDAELDYGRKTERRIADKRMEFDQLAADFRLSTNPVFLQKMAIVMESMDKDIDTARAFRALQAPYHRGIARARRQAADEAVQNGDRQFCTMLLTLGELHLRFGDPDQARANLERLGRRFDGEAYASYRQRAGLLLDELNARRDLGTTGSAPAAADTCSSSPSS